MCLATDSKRSTARFRVGRDVRLQITVVGETVLAALCTVDGDTLSAVTAWLLAHDIALREVP